MVKETVTLTMSAKVVSFVVKIIVIVVSLVLMTVAKSLRLVSKNIHKNSHLIQIGQCWDHLLPQNVILCNAQVL